MKTSAKPTTVKLKSDPKYKDTLFRKLFSEKERAIELCNAVAGTNYTIEASVVLCDTGNSLLRRYNDLALAFDFQLIVLCEHQSTLNPNMALRLLSHITDTLFSWFVDASKIYGKKMVKIPTPQFYVLYNGNEPLKQKTLRLSEAFKITPTGPSMELEVNIIDVNHESGGEILGKSRSLGGYAYLVAATRGFMDDGLTRDEAIQKAVQKCIGEDILADFLKENFEEVANMLTWEYDQEAEYRVIREEGMEEGMEKGMEKGMEEGMEKGREEGKAEAVRLITELVNSGLSLNEALSKMNGEAIQMA